MQRVERRRVLVQRVAGLFTIGPNQRRFIEELGNANNGAFELVLTPMIMAAIGVWLASVFGGGLLLPFALGFIGLGGVVYRLVTDYKVRMKQAEEGKPWAR